ncbi:hypothetical protein DQ04_05641000 [Trypanosoma grayi]|uniref:hypothetical protein n=1 Tax=Trypanosoma grayi TaxID=71804 RepID=UPI0004F4548D|nr:hypothetical protein DQ04_05641000 [Trypanosoma grayi]KEG09190.1 hypothetical protein DQ04_05641000 [Trypanosoma grayi]
MIPAEGLQPPEPQLPPVTFKAKSARGLAMMHGADHFSPVTLDAKTLIRKVFKEAPSNGAERRDCRRELQPVELLRIAAPIKVLEYQRVTVGSTSTKTFFLYNGTSASVLAAMPTEEAHLSFAPTSQVIPSGRAAAFDVSFYSSAVQTYQQVVQMTINGRHMLRFTLQADVVPVEVSLSRDDVVLHFADFSDDPVARASVVLSNHGNSEAAYTWELGGGGSGGGPFTITPMSGSIPSMSKVTAQVTFSPSQSILHAESRAELHVKGATAVKVLNLKGVVAPTSCVWVGSTPTSSVGEHVVELRQVPAGLPTATTATLYNRGRHSAFFSFESLPEWLTVTPMVGRVGAGESEDITLTVHHDTPGVLHTVLQCCVRGMKRPMKLRLTAEVCIAPLSILDSERQNGAVLLAFETVYIGTEKALPVRFSNSGDVAAVILVDLRHHVEYTLRCPDDGAASLEWRGHSEPVPGVVFVTISPRSEATVLVVYTPTTTTGDERFFVKWRHVGADEMNPLLPLTVLGRAMLSKVVVKRQQLEFPRTVVNTPAVPLSLTIENTSAEEVKWELLLSHGINSISNRNSACGGVQDDNDDDKKNKDASKDGVFHMSPDSGTLAPHTSQLVHVTFMPITIGHRQERYCVYLDGDKRRPCAEVHVSGFAALPRIVCDRNELIFPAIPLNVSVQETMYIANDGFDSIEVRYKSKESGPLNVTFPRGAIAMASSCIPVCVEFCCPKPVSFVSSITFTSDKGETLTIPVTGTAVNSFLTVAPYVMYQRGRSHFGAALPPVKEGKSEGEEGEEEWTQSLMYYDDAPAFTMTTSINVATPSSTLRRNGVSPDFHEQNLPPTTGPFGFVDVVGREMYTRQDIENLRQWLNHNILLEPATDLVGLLQSTDGRPLLDAAYRLSGRRPKRVSRPSARGRSLAALETLTSLIKSKGGCLSDVRLPYLMMYDTYCRHQESCGMEAITQAAFAVRAVHAWVTVVLQLIRAFYLPKVDVAAALQAYPAMKTYVPQTQWESAPFQAALHSSNVFSSEEATLLHWVAHNLSRCVEEGVVKGPRRSICRFDDLRDSVGMVACILAYVPSAATRLSLERLVPEPATQSEMENNAVVLAGALAYVGVPLRATPREMLMYNTVDWMLLSATLFLYLPRFIPTTVISLEGKLLAPMTRAVEVANTSATARSYTVEMSNTAFRALPQELSVDPAAAAHIDVEVTLRFNRRMEGECVLVDTSASLMEERAPIVLRLVAVPNNEPLRVIHVQTPLYTILNHEIQVESPFAQNCVATLRLSQDYTNDANYSEGDFGKSLQSAFYISAGIVPFRSGEVTKLSMQFAPCARGRYEASITFHDEQQGEFSYLVIGTCTPPKQSDKATTRAEAGEECTHTVLLKPSNAPFERMMRSLEDNRRSRTPRPTKGPLMPELTGVPYTVTFVNEANIGPNPFFRGPESITFATGESMFPLTFSFLPKYLGEYSGFIVLASKYDVRTIHILGKCVPTGDKGILRFACPARQCITQGVPIFNNSNENWLVTATVEGAGFGGPKELRVPRGKHRDYPLRYNPAWVSSEKGNLTLFNNETGERRIYALLGEAEEPLSEDTIVVECRARERRTETLTVPDINGADAMYNVETDLPFASGESSVLVRRGATAKYALVLQPMMGGTYAGTVVCRAPNGRYTWYAVTVVVSPPEKEGTVEIKTDARTPVTADVTIQNPTDKPIVFAVQRFGSGLFGENSLVVEAGAPAVYSLLFVPSHLGTFDGRLAFCSNEVGEFWYELRILVEEAAPEEITFESEIGVPEVVQVRIPNNTSVERSLYVSNTNPRNFATAPSLLTIPPYSELTVDIVYTPTAVNKPQEATLKLYNPDLGEWRYVCRGVGHQPATSAPVECVCEVGGNVSVTLKIKNPFEVPMIPVAKLECGSEGYYKLGPLQQQQQQAMAPGTESSISLTYAPKSVGNHLATVRVCPASTTAEGLQDITWEFPLRGVAEWRSSDASLRFRCVARRQVEDSITLEAPGLTVEEQKRVSVGLALDRQQQYPSAVQASFQSEVVLSEERGDALTVNIRFAPLRPFIATADLVVRCEKSAVWRYPIILDAVRAEPDDVLVVKAALRSASAVTFDMYNAFPHSSPFSAYFTPESSRDLSVTVARGVLRPFIVGQKNPAAATPLQVVFTPSARVPQVEGTLIVDTEEMQWSFRVVGKLESKSAH